MEIDDQNFVKLYIPCVEKPANKECCHYVRAKGCRLRQNGSGLKRLSWIKPNGYCSRFCKRWKYERREPINGELLPLRRVL